MRRFRRRLHGVHMKRFLIAVLAIVLSSPPIVSFSAPPPNISQTVGVCDPNFPKRCVAPNADGSVNVSGTITAALGAFQPASTYATLAVTTTSARVALPAGADVVIYNTGTAVAYVQLGSGSVVATTSNDAIQPGSWIEFATGSNVDLAAITSTGSTSLVISGGSGLASGSGGGSGGSGGTVNLTGINGTAPGITNPLNIAYGESADITGTFTNATQSTAITATNGDGYGTALVSINGTYGTATATFSGSDDGGANFYSIQCARVDGSALETGYTTLTNTNRQWVCPISGNDSIRVQSSAVASGTVNARISISSVPYTPSAISVPAGVSVTGGSVGLLAGAAAIGTVGIVNGGDIAEGSTTDTAATNGTSTATAIALLKAQLIAQQSTAPVAVKIDQTTPGTTNAVAALVNTAGVAVQATASVPVNISTATTTQLVALSSGKAIYVTSLPVIAGGTGNITYEYGTGTACATGTTALTGPLNLTAQSGIGPSSSVQLVVPASNALCVLTSAAVQMSGWVSYAQF